MLSSEHPQFEEQIKVLCAGYNIPYTTERVAAYWRGLMKMPLGTLERVIDHALGPEGPEKIPNPRLLWGIYRDMRASGAPRRPQEAAVKMDPYVQFANVRLLEFLMVTRGAASESSLVDLVLCKNKIVVQFQEVSSTDPRQAAQPYEVFEENMEVMREILMAEFDKRWQPMTDLEKQQHSECFARTRRLPGFSQGSLDRLNQRLL